VGIIKKGADLVYAFRFVRMLVMKWENWDAYKEGLIDAKGKRIKSVRIKTDAQKNAYTPFIRLVANLKRIIQKIPGGGSKLGSFASALFLLKEKYNMSDDKLRDALQEYGLDTSDILEEESQWFMLEDNQLSPGIYRVKEDKILNESYDEMVFGKDQIRVLDDSYPIGDIFGLNVYEATHLKTNKQVYVTANEIYK